MVLMAKSQGVPVNYEQLETDLKFWNDRTKTEWAAAFWIPGVGAASLVHGGGRSGIMSWLACMDIDAETVFASGVLDSYDWHQRLWHCFPGEPDRKRDFLTRIDTLEGAFRLWVLSPQPADPPRLVPAGEFCRQGNCPLFSLPSVLRIRLACQPRQVPRAAQ